jgi:phosphate transport system protein
MPDKHISSQFDLELNALCSSLLEMGGLVESQTQEAMAAFTVGQADTALEALRYKNKKNRNKNEKKSRKKRKRHG